VASIFTCSRSSEICAGPRFFQLANFGINSFERFLQRLDQFIDSFLLEVKIALRALLEFLQRYVRQFKKRLVVIFERIARQRLEFFRQLLRCLLEGVFSFLCGATFAFQLCPQLSVFLARVFVLGNLGIESIL
jgi:hypothetical protein